MSDSAEKLSKVEDDAEYEAYYDYILSDLKKAGLPRPEESAKEITGIIFGLVETYHVEDLDACD